jgi:signal transduction histidine kinase
VNVLHDILTYLNAGIFTALAFFAASRWTQQPGPASTWLFCTFGSLSLLTVISLFEPENPQAGLWPLVVHLSLALIVLFPWFLYHFATSFGSRRRLVGAFFDLFTLGVLIATLVIAPETGELDPLPTWYLIYVAAIAAQWLLLLGAASFKFWMAGRHQPTIARRRMQLLGTGAVGMAAALLLLAGTAGASERVITTFGIVSQILGAVSAILFFVGFVTPKFLRAIWRMPEQNAMRAGVQELLSVTSADQLQTLMMPQMARLIASDKVVFMDRTGEVIGTHGVTAEEAVVAQKRFFDPEARERKRELLATGRVHTDTPVLPMDFSFGTLLIWINPYMPYFGAEEFELLNALGVIFSLALERTRALESEQAKARELAQVSKLKDEFVAMASHELRTPLTSILGFTQTVRGMHDQLTEAQRDEFLEIVENQAVRLQRLVEDMLTLSRIESGGLKVNSEAVSVRRAIDDAAMALSATSLAIDCDENLAVQADPHHLHQILINYLTNAMRYGQEPYRMAAWASKDAKRVTIVVEDKGAGVPADFVPRLFDRFSQAPQAGQSATGTGLGLSIVKQMARAQGGEVWYEPREGGGSRFGVTLPAARNAPAPPLQLEGVQTP